MSDPVLKPSVAETVAVRSNNSLMTPQESDRAETSKKYTVILNDHITTNSRNFDYISVEDYRKVLAKEEGFGITEIVMGIGEVILGLVTFVAGVLLLQPWMIVGGVLSVVSGGLSIAAGITRPFSPYWSERLAYTSIAVGVVGLLFSLYGGYRAGMSASKLLSRAARGRSLGNPPPVLSNPRMMNLAAAIVSNSSGGPAFMSNINIAYGVTLSTGGILTFANMGQWHSFNKRVESRYQSNYEKKNMGGAE